MGHKRGRTAWEDSPFVRLISTTLFQQCANCIQVLRCALVKTDDTGILLTIAGNQVHMEMQNALSSHLMNCLLYTSSASCESLT